MDEVPALVDTQERVQDRLELSIDTRVSLISNRISIPRQSLDRGVALHTGKCRTLATCCRPRLVGLHQGGSRRPAILPEVFLQCSDGEPALLYRVHFSAYDPSGKREPVRHVPTPHTPFRADTHREIGERFEFV